jgi:hypothetical protein
MDLNKNDALRRRKQKNSETMKGMPLSLVRISDKV